MEPKSYTHTHLHCEIIQRTKKYQESKIDIIHMNSNTNSSWHSKVKREPEDTVFAIARQYQTCQLEKRVNLSLGEIRNEDGSPHVLNVVTRAKVSDTIGCQLYFNESVFLVPF